MNVSTLLALTSLVAAFAAQQAMAQAPAATGTAVTATVGKLSSDSLVGDILDTPAAKAVLLKHLPAIGESDQIDQARGMSLRSLQDFAPEAFTDKVLAAIDADLAALPAQKPAPATPGASGK